MQNALSCWKRRVLRERGDLNEEEIEELRMITGFSLKVIRRSRKKFLIYAQSHSKNRTSDTASVAPDEYNFSEVPVECSLSLEQFLAIPAIAANPLNDRLALCFGFVIPQDDNSNLRHTISDTILTGSSSISFREFMVALSVFNATGQREKKLSFSFHIQDFDGDGKIGKADLLAYFDRVMLYKERFSPLDHADEVRWYHQNLKLNDEKDESDIAEDNRSWKSRELSCEELDSTGILKEDLERLAECIITESASDGRYLHFEDFKRVVASGDFESRLYIDIFYQ
jgi:Ca2+-binding EF-hand superfamily protein